MKHYSKLDKFMDYVIDKIECVGEFLSIFAIIYLILQLLRVWV